MRTTPCVSVCIQTYQHKAFIADAIQSVLCQKTNFPFEIIIGEDDSTDGTRDICREFAGKYPDIIRLFERSEEDKIYINGKKTGRFNFLSNLRSARGEFIALLDGDDCWIDPGKLQKQVDFFSKYPGISICTHRYIKQLPNGKTEQPLSFYWGEKEAIYPSASLLEAFYISMSSSLFRSSSIQNLPGWFETVPYIDFPLIMYISQFGDIGYIPDTMTRYNIHRSGGWSGTRAPGNQIKIWLVLTIMAPHFTGMYRTEFETRREKIGKELIAFYRTHFWQKSDWLKKDLMENKFAADRNLLQEYERGRKWDEYLKNVYFGVKEIIRPFVQPFR